LKTTSKYIKHDFTENEKKEIAGEMAQKMVELNELEVKKKDVMAQIKSEISSVESSIQILSGHYHSGFEMKSVKCKVKEDLETKTISYIRIDTNECIEKRDMTSNELQLRLFEDEEE